MLAAIVGRLCTWWNSQTLGTQLYTWRHGHMVGKDANGFRYYQTVDGRRRWVVYRGDAEASRVPPEWHAWLHHIVEAPPDATQRQRQPWQLDHQPNLTGTDRAYAPPGSLRRTGSEARRDYEAWTPDQ